MTCSACDRGWVIWRQSNMARAICLEKAKLIKAPPKPRARAQTNELRSTDPCRSIPNMGRTKLISNGTVSESVTRSEEHTSELQSLTNLVCRLLLEKKK